VDEFKKKNEFNVVCSLTDIWIYGLLSNIAN